jgi:hypothetical protein
MKGNALIFTALYPQILRKRQKNEEKNKAMIEKTFHGAPLQYELSETLSHEFQKSHI